MIESFKTVIAKKSFYAYRPLLNKNDIRIWAASQGFHETVDDLHVTEAYSKSLVQWSAMSQDNNQVKCFDTNREMKQFGDAFVLIFHSPEIEKRWRYFRDKGCSWDYPDYHPHVTISYKAPKKALKDIKPYHGVLIFSGEKFEELDDNYKSKIKEV